MVLSTSPPITEPLDPSETRLRVTSAQFDELCIHNPDLRLELTKDRELIVMAPAGGETGERNFRLAAQLAFWNERYNLGRGFDSSTGYDFTAIGSGKLSPDVSWIEKSRLDGVSIKQFIPIVPDFVIELRPESDLLKDVQKKMREYQRIGVRLGLLIDPRNRQVEIYRPAQPVESLKAPATVDCGTVLPGFTLDLIRAGIWPMVNELARSGADQTVEEIARQQERKAMVLRLLSRKIGNLNPQQLAGIESLSADLLLDLSDALLDFNSSEEFDNWLKLHVQ